MYVYISEGFCVHTDSVYDVHIDIKGSCTQLGHQHEHESLLPPSPEKKEFKLKNKSAPV